MKYSWELPLAPAGGEHVSWAIYGNLCSKENSTMIGFYIKHEWPWINQNTMKYSWKFSKVSAVDCNMQWMSRFSTDTWYRWGVGALFYRVNDFYFWSGTEQRSSFLEQSTFVPIQIARYFQRFPRAWKNIFTSVKKYFQQSEKVFWIYPNCSTCG